METTLYTAAGREVCLAPLANGNRGYACAVQGMPGCVCKVMGTGHRGAGRRQKVEWLAAHAATIGRAAPALVLPRESVFDEGGAWAGFLMDKVEGVVLEQIACNPRVPSRTRTGLAHRVACAVAQAHRADVFVGDVSLGNMMWDAARKGVRVLDPDSFQVRDVAARRLYVTGEMREQTPEVVAGAGRGPVRISERGEAFALAIALFKLLFWGIHPLETGECDVDAAAMHVRCIREHRFPYVEDPGLMPLDSYGLQLAQLFGATFLQDAHAPTALHYAHALGDVARAGFGVCPRCGFEHSKLAPACPNCGGA